MEYDSGLLDCLSIALKQGKLAEARQCGHRFAAQLEKLQPMDLLEFGSYRIPSSEKPNDLYISAPIGWLVLARQGRRLLLVSRRCLDWEFFDGSGPLFAPCPAAAWQSSYAREYLNGDCFSQWFSPAQQAIIPTVQLSTPANPLTGGPAGPETQDRLFLLSWQELAALQPGRPECVSPQEGLWRLAAPWLPASLLMADRDWPEEQRIQLYRHPCCWWLRTGGLEEGDMAVVEANGLVNLAGRDAGCDEVGLRPALWLDLDLAARLPELLRPEQL